MYEPTTIEREGVIYIAALCEMCGTKVYPIQTLAAHQDHHVLRALVHKGYLLWLQERLNRYTMSYDGRRGSYKKRA